MFPVLITPKGRVLSDTKDAPLEVETSDKPLWLIAQEEADRVSTKNHQQGE
jgi:hypothetical protein